jgi:hypothetical protein
VRVDVLLDGFIRPFGELPPARFYLPAVRRHQRTIRRKRRNGPELRWHASRNIAKESSMNRLHLLFLSLVLTFPLAAVAQHGDDAATPSSAPAEARQFDFLLGQWQLDVRPKVSGLAAMIHGAPRLVGTWKAERSADGLGIDDEMRIVDASGNPISLTRAHRIYSGSEGQWKISGQDVTHARNSEATAKWLGGEMHVEGHSADAGSDPSSTRTRYFDISADSFRMRQDRSSDNGQTWDEGTLTIDAKRVAATATR